MPIDLRALRDMLGIDAEEAATLAGISVGDLEKAEQHPAEESGTARRVIEAYGLSADVAQESDSAVSPHQATEGSLFFFRGTHTVIESEDLPAFSMGLGWARIWAASVHSADAQARRRAILPRPIVAEHPASAAKQGYVLARRIRVLCGSATEPIDDVCALIEREFGITITAADFESRGLRGATALAKHRAAAAIIIRTPAPNRGIHARVTAAHELCHALFDDHRAQGITLTLDHQRHRDGDDLSESRAKAFAAEFLVPLSGLMKLIGPPVPIERLVRGQEVLRLCCDHFGSPPTLTTYHLFNHGYLTGVVCDRLLDRAEEHYAHLVPVDAETPPVGGPPRCLATMLTPPAVDPVTLARSAESAWSAAEDRWISSIVKRAVDIARSGALREAGLELSRVADNALCSGDMAALSTLFDKVEEADLPPRVIRAVLTNTRGANLPSPARRHLIERVCASYLERGKEPRDVDALRQRLR